MSTRPDATYDGDGQDEGEQGPCEVDDENEPEGSKDEVDAKFHG